MNVKKNVSPKEGAVAHWPPSVRHCLWSIIIVHAHGRLSKTPLSSWICWSRDLGPPEVSTDVQTSATRDENARRRRALQGEGASTITAGFNDCVLCAIRICKQKRKKINLWWRLQVDLVEKYCQCRQWWRAPTAVLQLLMMTRARQPCPSPWHPHPNPPTHTLYMCVMIIYRHLLSILWCF